PARGRVPRCAPGDDGRQGAPAGAPGRGAVQARSGEHADAQRLVRSVYWDLGEGVVIRTDTPADADGVFALVDRNRERLRPLMVWEPGTKNSAGAPRV